MQIGTCGKTQGIAALLVTVVDQACCHVLYGKGLYCACSLVYFKCSFPPEGVYGGREVGVDKGATPTVVVPTCHVVNMTKKITKTDLVRPR